VSPLLQVEGLQVAFDTPRGTARAVDGVDFSLQPGETLCIVGESGCGKSVTALSIMGLVPTPPARVSGRIRFEGRDLRVTTDLRAAIRPLLADHLQVPRAALDRDVLPGSSGLRSLDLLRSSRA
jgi:ABC-type dipeptide/oligopeptide/nickel transport system ATPase component